MERVNIEESRESLAQLVARVEEGETVVIARGGVPVVRMTPVVESADEPEKAIDFARMEKVADALPFQQESAGDFMRRLRDEARY